MKRSVVLLVSLIFLLSLFSSSVVAQSAYHLKLLAVQENDLGQYSGSDADLYLELRPGTGRVFLETMPLTKLDTQISTRFAKDIVCSHLKLNCNKYDFIYTIRAKSNIIGGPSAGAAVAALTAIAVMDLPYDQSIAVTGTINSGGLVGPVGGIKEKIAAASIAGIKKVLIPYGSQAEMLEAGNVTNGTVDEVDNEKNNSISKLPEAFTNFSLIEFGKSRHLEVQEVLDIDEVLLQLTGKDFRVEESNLTEDPQYQMIMGGIAKELCLRSETILKEIDESHLKLDNETEKLSEEAQENSNKASAKSDYYAAASFCFGNNIRLRNFYYKEQKVSLNEISQLFNILGKKVEQLDQSVAEKQIETIADLQTAMIVKERINDALEQKRLFQEEKVNGKAEELSYFLAYAEERYTSAISWMSFFAMEGKKYEVKAEDMQQVCIEKISEAQERLQYVELFIPQTYLTSLQRKLVTAEMASSENNSILCIMSAAQTKADVDAILGSLGADNSTLQKFIDVKKKAASGVIAENIKDGNFPILGYSYYQYALALRENDPGMALVYLEYALEMSDLQVYFPEKLTLMDKIEGRFSVDVDWRSFAGGLLSGVVIVLVVLSLWLKFSRKPKSRKEYGIK